MTIRKALLAAIICFFGTSAYADTEAVLLKDDSECIDDHMVFGTNRGFVNAEWYGGSLWEGETYFGDFESYGFADVFDAHGDKKGRVYIDNYLVSSEVAFEHCYVE